MAQPINIEAEQLALITILNSKSKDKLLVGKLLGALSTDDFGSEPGVEVMARVTNRTRKGLVIPRCQAFMTDQTLSDDAKEFLRNITCKPVRDEASVEDLIDTLKFHRKIRKIVMISGEMLKACKKASEDDVNAIESKLDQLTLDIKGRENTTKVVTFGSGDRSAADAVIRRISNKDNSNRILTGFKYFDSLSGGSKKGHAFLIAGPAGGGKSALANQLLINMYVNPPHHKTLFVSFEMDEEECISRMAANITGIEFSTVEQKKMDLKETTKLNVEIDRFHQIGIDHDSWFKVWPPDDSLTAANIISYCRPLAPDVLVVDYIGLLGQDNQKEEQWKSLGSAMRQFKMAAKKLNCLIIVLAQFDQDAMVVKYARALREHANIMWCWQYDEAEQESGIVTIRQKAPYGKNRNCTPFDFRLKWDLKYMRIHDFGAADKTDQPEKGERKGKFTTQNGVKTIKNVPRTLNASWEDD